MPELSDLSDQISNSFNVTELQSLCFKLSIEYENLSGGTRIGKTISLVEYCTRHGLLPSLIAHCKELRPHLSWEFIADRQHYTEFSSDKDYPGDFFEVNLSFDDQGKLLGDRLTLRAMLEEAIFAAENQRQLVFGASFMPIDKLKEQIEAISRESSPEDRIKHVRLMRKLSNYNDKLNKVSRALPLLFLQPILGTFSTVNGLMTSIEGIGITVFGGMPDFVQGHALDVFREHWPQISAIIYIDEAEADEIAERAGLKSILSLLGHGWDLYLLPLETRLRKAIPAIVLEVNYQNERLDKELELLKVLNLDSWSIGLH